MKVPSIAYVTPLLSYDAEARVNILQYRDSDSGKVTRQIPGELAVKAYRAAIVDPVGVAEPTAAAAPSNPPPQRSADAVPATDPTAEPAISLEA
jgi:hypothetical protein